MSYASGTTHYNLPQTVGSDKRDWTDTNQAFSDIDAAIYGAAQGASAATSAIETINGEIETITGKQAVDEGNISTLSGKVSTLESTVGTQAAAIADVRQDLQDNIESYNEASATSTHSYNVGDYFYYNDILYRATASIAIGATIVPNTNCAAVTVMDEIHSIKSDIEKGSVTITADGTETYTAALNRLFAALNLSKINSKSKFIFDMGTDKAVASVARITTGAVNFTQVVASVLSSVSQVFEIKATGSSYGTINVAAGGTTVTDNSSAVPTAGFKFIVEY